MAYQKRITTRQANRAFVDNPDPSAYNPKEDEKVYFGTGLLDSIERSVGNWYMDARTLEGYEWLSPSDIVTAGALRSVEGVFGAIGHIPGLSHGLKGLQNVEDWVADKARDLNEQWTPWLDPRWAGWGSRIATGWVGDRGLGKVAKVAKASKLGKGLMKSINKSAEAALSRFPAEAAYAAGRGLSPAGDVPYGVNRVRTLDEAMTGAGMARERILQDFGPITTRRIGRAMDVSELGESGRFFTEKGLMRGQVYVHDQSLRPREVMARLQTPQGQWIPGEFNQVKAELLPDFLEEFKPYMDARGLTGANIELHHIFFLGSAMPLYDGLRYMSPEWVRLTQTLWDLGHKPGHNPSDLVMTFRKKLASQAGGIPEPHDLLHHKYMVDEIGQRGQKFFTPERIAQIKGSEAGRLKAATAYAGKMNKGKRFINEAMDQLRIAFGTKNIDPERLAHVLEFALDDGSLKIAGTGYALDSVSAQMKNIVSDINWLNFLDSIKTVKTSNITTEGMLMLKARLAGTDYRTIRKLHRQGYYNPDQIKLFELQADTIYNRLTPSEINKLTKQMGISGKGGTKMPPYKPKNK